MARRSGTVSIDYTGQAGGEAARAVRDALNGTGEAEARQADASAVRALLDRQYGGSIQALAAKMGKGAPGKDPVGNAERLIQRVLDGTRGMSKKTQARIVAVSDKRLKETKAVRDKPPRKRAAPPLDKNKAYKVTMQYQGQVHISADKRKERTLPPDDPEEFTYRPGDQNDPLNLFLGSHDGKGYGFDNWNGQGVISFTIEEATGGDDDLD